VEGRYSRTPGEELTGLLCGLPLSYAEEGRRGLGERLVAEEMHYKEGNLFHTGLFV
jgi:hypothetical protein